MKRPTNALIGATSLACLMAWSLPPLLADNAPPSNASLVGQSVSEQKHIRSQTQRASSELDALLLEFDRNGIGDGADVQILKNIRNALASLSDKDMEKVINLLESAKKGDPHAVTRALADAFSGQTGISVELHQLLVEYQHQQDLAEISLRLIRLADTENENMKAGTGLYRSSKGASPRNYNDVQKAQLQVQRSQQQAIHDEAKLLLDQLAKLAQSGDPATADRLKSVVAAASSEKIADTLGTAADDLKDANLFSAVGKERIARDNLRDLARLAAPTRDPVAALKDAADTLAQAIRQENYVAQQARQVKEPDKDDVDTAARLDDQQADIIDAADGVKKDVANLTPEAVPDLANAQDQMQESRPPLKDGKGKDAADKAVAATQQLTQARDKLLAEIKRREDAQKADDKIAQEKALLEQIIALRKREELLQTDTGNTRDAKAFEALAPRQALLLANAQDLQKAAATDTPAVADAIGDAAKSMDASQPVLATEHNGPQAVKDEQLAVDDLKKAEKLLSAEIDRLEKVRDELAKLQKARDKVDQAVKDQTKVEMDTNKLAQKDNQKPDAADPKPKDLAPKEDKIADTAKDAAKDVADAAPQAAKPLADAGKKADDAKDNLNKPDPKAADPDAKQALNNLQKGLNEIDKKIAQDKKDLDLPDDTADKLADADKAVDQALNDLDNADTDPVAQMKDQQAQIAKDLKNMPPTPDTANAQQAAQKAADDLGKNDLPQAAKDMQDAQDNMQKAMDAAKPDAGKPDAGKPDAGKPDAGKPGAKLPELAQKQDALQKQLADMQAGTPPPSDDGAATTLSDAQADDGAALPQDAQDALAQAQGDSSDAGAQKAAGKSPAASRAQAKAALAKAKGAIAMAKAGLGQGQPMAQGNGPPQPGDQPGDQPGQGKEDPNSKGKGDRKDANAGADSKSGGHGATGQSAYVGLPPRDRDAIQQSRGEKYPEEYGPMIEQYLKNLSDQTSK